MKKFLLLSLMALAFLSLNATVYTMDLQNGSLTKGKSDTAPTRAAGHKNAAMRSEESIIDENKVWMSGYEVVNDVYVKYQTFHGIEIINGKEYHKFYVEERNIKDFDANYYENLKQLNTIPEFDFENTKPKYYIRQNGQKYYMLLGDKYFDDNGELIVDLSGNNSMNFPFCQYGSNILETLIYDFSVEPDGHYFRCEYPNMPENNIFNFPESGFYHWEFDGLRQSNRIDITKYQDVKSCDKIYNCQENLVHTDGNYFENYHITYLASPIIGSLDGCIAAPGFIEPGHIESSGMHGLVNVRTLDGEYIYGEPFSPWDIHPSGMKAVEKDTETEVYYSVDGRRVYGNPAPGVYIERKGESVRKVVIK